jgi:carbonic anhydrase
MRIAESAKFRVLARAPEDVHTECEYEAVKLSLGNLMTFPWLAERVEAGLLKLTGMSFDIRSGQLLMLQGDGTFAPVDTP